MASIMALPTHRAPRRPRRVSRAPVRPEAARPPAAARSGRIIATWNCSLQLLGVQLVQRLQPGTASSSSPEHAPRSQRRLLEIACEAGLTAKRWTDRTHARSWGPTPLRACPRPRPLHRIDRGRPPRRRDVRGGPRLEHPGTQRRDSAIVLDDADPAAESVWHALVMNAGDLHALRAGHPGAHDAFCSELARRANVTDPVRLVQPEEVSRCRAGRTGHRGGARPDWTGPMMIEHASGGHRGLPARCNRPGKALGPWWRCFAARTPRRSSVGIARSIRLSTSVFTSRPRLVEDLLDELGSGIVTINDCVLPAGHPASPITGRSASGWGSSQGLEGLMELTRPVVLSRTGRIGRLPTEVPSARIQDVLKGMLRRGARRG